MAKSKLDLSGYQQTILAKLEEVKSVSSTQSSTRLATKAGNQSYIVNLQHVSEVLPVPNILKVPLTQSWALGLSNIRGRLYMVVDLAGFMGGEQAQINSESRLLLIHDDFEVAAALLVSQLVGLRDTQQMIAMKAAQEEVAQEDWFGVSYKDTGNAVWKQMHIDKLVTNTRFLQITH